MATGVENWVSASHGAVSGWPLALSARWLGSALHGRAAARLLAQKNFDKMSNIIHTALSRVVPSKPTGTCVISFL